MFFKGFVTMVTAVGQTGQGPCCAHHPHMVDQSQPFNIGLGCFFFSKWRQVCRISMKFPPIPTQNISVGATGEIILFFLQGIV